MKMAHGVIPSGHGNSAEPIIMPNKCSALQNRRIIRSWYGADCLLAVYLLCNVSRVQKTVCTILGAIRHEQSTLHTASNRREAGVRVVNMIFPSIRSTWSSWVDILTGKIELLKYWAAEEGGGVGGAGRALSAWVAVLLFKLFNLGISFSAWHRCIDFRTQVSFKSEVWGTCEQFHSVWLWEEKCWWQLVFSAVYKIICFHWVGIKVRLFAWWPLFLFIFFAPHSVWLLMSAAAPSPLQIYCESVKTGIFNQTIISRVWLRGSGGVIWPDNSCNFNLISFGFGASKCQISLGCHAVIQMLGYKSNKLTVQTSSTPISWKCFSLFLVQRSEVCFLLWRVSVATLLFLSRVMWCCCDASYQLIVCRPNAPCCPTASKGPHPRCGVPRGNGKVFRHTEKGKNVRFKNLAGAQEPQKKEPDRKT